MKTKQNNDKIRKHTENPKRVLKTVSKNRQRLGGSLVPTTLMPKFPGIALFIISFFLGDEERVVFLFTLKHPRGRFT
jgi:hypothetical protein